MTILKNAIDSIAIGLEDYQSPDNRRIVSSARNIFAGILLLFKHKLCELSPPNSDEALIKTRVLPQLDPTGALSWIGKGKKTVDVSNIQERFDSLDILVDWKRLKRVNDYRNDVEHYYSNLNTASVQQLISDSFIIIRDFISDHLDDDPKSLLGEKYWKILVDVNEVYEKEKLECNNSLESLSYYNDQVLYSFQAHHCSECGSGLIEPTKSLGDAALSEFSCRSCDHAEIYEDLVELAASEYFEGAMYISMTDGGDPPITDCSDCGGIYLYEENICASCGHEAVGSCIACGQTILAEEMSLEPYCGWCANRLEKVMAE